MPRRGFSTVPFRLQDLPGVRQLDPVRLGELLRRIHGQGHNLALRGHFVDVIPVRVAQRQDRDVPAAAALGGQLHIAL